MAKTIKEIKKKDALDLYNPDREEFYRRMSVEQKVMFSSIKENTFTFCESLNKGADPVKSIPATKKNAVNCLSSGVILFNASSYSTNSFSLTLLFHSSEIVG